jgi:hypothetical protein
LCQDPILYDMPVMSDSGNVDGPDREAATGVEPGICSLA